MTDQPALDPKRPWITDARDTSENSNLLATLFNPLGKSRKLSFTRAWTILFFVQLLAIVGLNFLAVLLGIAGGDPKSLQNFSAYLIPVVFLVTGFITYVPHVRRLSDAGKPTLLAIITLIPVLLACGLMMATLVGNSASYNEMAVERNAYLSDPEGFEAQKREEVAEARAKAKAEREKAEAEQAANGPSSRDARRAARSGARGGRRGGRRGGGGGGGFQGTPKYKQDLPKWSDHVLKPALGAVLPVMIGLNFFIMFWSLLWLARKPSADDASGQSRPLETKQPYQA